MRMEHKRSEHDDDLLMSFKPKSPTATLAHSPFYNPPINPTPAPLSEKRTHQSSLQTTRSIFESKIKCAENEEVLQAPRMVSQVPAWKQRPKSDIYSDVYLEPGPEPEFCFAPKPTLVRKKSLVETLEENIEKQLENEPARIPPGGVRLIPMRRERTSPPQPKEKRYSAPMTLHPETPLEPFPFTAPPERTQQSAKPNLGPPPTPSKFIKGNFSDTNYESDFSDYSYFEKKFKHVTPPRPKSTEPNQSRANQCSTPKYDFTSLPLKQMIQNGSPIPLYSPQTTSTCPPFTKSRPASGYTADTEEQTNWGYQSNSDTDRIYNQVGECAHFMCVFDVFARSFSL